MADRKITGIVYALHLDGAGEPTSNYGQITISADGTADGTETVCLTGPGANPVHTVTIEQFMARVAAIYRSYCLRVPISFTVRDGIAALPVIMNATIDI